MQKQFLFIFLESYNMHGRPYSRTTAQEGYVMYASCQPTCYHRNESVVETICMYVCMYVCMYAYSNKVAEWHNVQLVYLY